MRRTLHDVVAAAAWAGALSGAPSTALALARGEDPLAATRAAGAMLLPGPRRDAALLPAAAVVHAALSLGWAAVLAQALPRRHAALTGAAAGLAIGVLDLAIADRFFPAVATLPRGAQLADHAAYGLVVGTVLSGHPAWAARARWRHDDLP